MPAVGSGRSAHDSASSVRGAIRKSSFSTTSVTSPIPRSKIVGLLEDRGVDLAIAVARGEIGGEALEARPRRPLGGQQVAGAPRGAWGRHGPEV